MSSSFKDFMKLGLVVTDLENVHLFSCACEFIPFDNSEMLGKVGTLHSKSPFSRHKWPTGYQTGKSTFCRHGC